MKEVYRGCRIVAIMFAFQAKDTGSIPVTRSHALVAQWIERLASDQEVTGSTPVGGTE